MPANPRSRVRSRARTGLPLFDLDQLLVDQVGGSISEFFASRGETAFRALERATIDKLVAQHERAIIALGGGGGHEPRATPRAASGRLSGDARRFEVDELAKRVGSGHGRPLLERSTGGNAREKLARLRRERAEAYAECHVRIDTTGSLEPERAARTIYEAASEEPIVVPLGQRTYRVFVGTHNRHTLPARVQELAPVSSMLVVSDTQVGPAWGARAEHHLALAQSDSDTSRAGTG